MNDTTELLQTEIKNIPSLQPLRVRFCTTLAFTIVLACACLAVMCFAPHLVLMKFLAAFGVLCLAIQLHRQSSAWSDALHTEYLTLSQRLLNMCRNRPQEVKSWLATPNLQPWAQHVLQQYLKDYATAAV